MKIAYNILFVVVGLIAAGCKSSKSSNLNDAASSNEAQDRLVVTFEDNSDYKPTGGDYFTNYRLRDNVLLNDEKLKEMLKAALTSKVAKISLVDCENIGKNAFFRDIIWERPRDGKNTAIYDYEHDTLFKGTYYKETSEALSSSSSDLLGNNKHTSMMQTEPRLVIQPDSILPRPPYRWLILDPQQTKPDEYNIIGFAFWYTNAFGGTELNVINIVDILTIYDHATKKDQPRFFIDGVQNCYNK